MRACISNWICFSALHLAWRVGSALVRWVCFSAFVRALSHRERVAEGRVRAFRQATPLSSPTVLSHSAPDSPSALQTVPAVPAAIYRDCRSAPVRAHGQSTYL